jgi:hypothetical protein
MWVEQIHVTKGTTSATTDARLAIIGAAKATFPGLPEWLIASVVSACAASAAVDLSQ